MVNSIRETIVLKIFYLYNFYLGVYIGVCGGHKKGVRFLRDEVIGSCEPHNICARKGIQVSWKKSKSSKY